MIDPLEIELAPFPTIQAMSVLGAIPVGDLLGSYQHLLSERGRLFGLLLQDGVRDPEAWAETSRELFAAWQACERRLGLYALLAHEAVRT